MLLKEKELPMEGKANQSYFTSSLEILGFMFKSGIYLY